MSLNKIVVINLFALVLICTSGQNVNALNCKSWSEAKMVGTLDRSINEASGLAKSDLRENLFYWVNDSGNSPTIYLTREDGKIIKEVQIIGERNIDFEASEVGPCPNSVESCLYIADFGNNSTRRNDLRFLIFKEADLLDGTHVRPFLIKDFSYATGSRNAEAFFVTEDRRLFIITKEKEASAQLHELNILSGASKTVFLGNLNISYLVSNSTPNKKKLVTDASYDRASAEVSIMIYGGVINVSLSTLLDSDLRTQNWIENIDYKFITTPSALVKQETVSLFNNAKSLLVSTEEKSFSSRPVYRIDCRE